MKRTKNALKNAPFYQTHEMNVHKKEKNAEKTNCHSVIIAHKNLKNNWDYQSLF